MSGTTTPRKQRGTQMADFQAVVRRKQANPELTTAMAIRLTAKSRRKSYAAVQQAYYKYVKTMDEQAASPQPIAPTIKPKPSKTKPSKTKVAASMAAKQSLASALKAIEDLEKENAFLLKKNDSLQQQNLALKARLSAVRAAL